MWLYSLVCVKPGRKPRRPVFSQRGSNGPENVHLTSGPGISTMSKVVLAFNIGQGQHTVISYIKFVGIESLNSNHLMSGSKVDLLKVFPKHVHDNHLGHVTWTIYLNFCSPKRLLIKEEDI